MFWGGIPFFYTSTLGSTSTQKGSQKDLDFMPHHFWISEVLVAARRQLAEL